MFALWLAAALPAASGRRCRGERNRLLIGQALVPRKLWWLPSIDKRIEANPVQFFISSSSATDAPHNVKPNREYIKVARQIARRPYARFRQWLSDGKSTLTS